MKTKYFEKVENKYVFNLTLIFWHIFIALSTLAIVISLCAFLWSIIPPSEKKAEKKDYPAKKEYPAPVTVALNELNLEEVKKEEALPEKAPEQVPAPVATKPIPVEDTKGKAAYEASINTLKTLIPPAKYSWTGSGTWSYPYGERYWTFYKQEKYRHWNITESGIEDKLKYAFVSANAVNYTNKKLVLDGYISVVKLLPDAKRLTALQYLMNNVAGSVSQNITICKSLTSIVSKMAKEKDITYLNQLAGFGKLNPNDGSLFIDYVATIIEKFDTSQRVTIIDRLDNYGYNGYFSQNLSTLKEATNLFLPLVSQIKANQQSKAILQYYRLYLDKNRDRDNLIAQIESEHQQSINEIDHQYKSDQLNARFEYQAKQKKKEELRQKSLMGIGGGIVLIVLIASVLVFLSIQRSVKKIEEKISAQNNFRS